MKNGFRAMLAERQEKVKSLVCVGLDPLPEKLPGCLEECAKINLAEAVQEWMTDVVSATAGIACMFKPNVAHWEAILGGTLALRNLVSFIHQRFPGIPVFLDCKCGDIARTQEQYRIAWLDLLGADGMNFSPYMGRDCMSALVDPKNLGRALVGLCYTSNPSARQIQDAILLSDGYCLWEHVAEETLRWATDLGVVANAGLVMAAAYEREGKIFSKHLIRCRQIVGNNLWFLIPGIGTQGGLVAETVRASYLVPGSIAINSSSAIIFASSGENYAEAAAQKTRELRDQINVALKP